MRSSFKFAVVSDLHIALPETIWDHPSRFHLVEVSIPVLELVLEHLGQLDLDFLLLPGDLTQHGERENHLWLSERLAKLPYPVYVVPGNHDVPVFIPQNNLIALNEFPQYYQRFGYQQVLEEGRRQKAEGRRDQLVGETLEPKWKKDNRATQPANQPSAFLASRDHLDYTLEILPGVQLIGLNSNHFNESGTQVGCLQEEQFHWLEQVLSAAKEQLILLMIHHNVIEHLPGQATNPLGRRYMLENAPRLLNVLKEAGVQLIFTGHLHVQDIAQWQGIYEITTGSLVSYPHPYRVIEVSTNSQGKRVLDIESYRVQSVPDWPELHLKSREWIGERSFPFMMKLLLNPPLNLPPEDAEKIAPYLRYFWADIADGDAQFNFADFPPSVRRYFEGFSATELIDNRAKLQLH